jgi:hypothetical protein
MVRDKMEVFPPSVSGLKRTRKNCTPLGGIVAGNRGDWYKVNPFAGNPVISLSVQLVLFSLKIIK